jgi:hypothetical protein
MLFSSLIFLFYTALFLFTLYRLSLKPSFALSFKEAALAFLVKIAAGCFYGYFFLHFYGGDDTWLYHNEGLKEFALLKADPLHFLTSGIIPSGYKDNQLFTIFNSSDSFAKDLELTLLFKLLAIFDLLSGGRYYVNVIFFDVLVFWGTYLLFATVCKKYPGKRNLWLLFIFYFPPLLFWTGGIRKDGLCFSIFCGLIYQLYSLCEIRFSGKRFVYLSCLFVILFLIRKYIALAFIPVIIAYILSSQTKMRPLLIFFTISVCCIAAFFLTALLPDSFNFPLKMAERQQAFLQLSGNSYIPIDTLNGTIYSYSKTLPQAFNHVFIRPYFTEAKGLLYIFSFLDILFFLFLVVRTIVKPAVNLKQLINDPLILSFILIALLNYIIIGYTVPFLGAIVRYKASFEILFILALLLLQKDIPIPAFSFKRKKTSHVSTA